MQQIFPTDLTPEEFFNLGLDFPFPRPQVCLNPDCRIPVAPKKHGFYARNAIDFKSVYRISIRRYYCPYCGRTFSYLPSFCLPYFQYTLELIFLGLLCHFFKLAFLLLAFLKARSVGCQRQHLQFYGRRFLNNLKPIQLGIRQFMPEQELMNLDNKQKGAQKILGIVLSGFPGIKSFSQRFFAQCNHSFMAPC